MHFERIILFLLKGTFESRLLSKHLRQLQKKSPFIVTVLKPNCFGRQLPEVPALLPRFIHPSLKSADSGPAGVKEIAHSELESNVTMLGVQVRWISAVKTKRTNRQRTRKEGQHIKAVDCIR